jgi:hypothetical protein
MQLATIPAQFTPFAVRRKLRYTLVRLRNMRFLKTTCPWWSWPTFLGRLAALPASVYRFLRSLTVLPLEFGGLCGWTLRMPLGTCDFWAEPCGYR